MKLIAAWFILHIARALAPLVGDNTVRDLKRTHAKKRKRGKAIFIKKRKISFV